MAIVTDIKPQKKPHYFNIFVDNAFFCSLSELQLSQAELKIGAEIEAEYLKKLLAQSALSKTYNRALFYLKYGPRTQQQMQRYLLSKEFAQHNVDLAIDRLKQDGYINDTKFAQALVEDLGRRKSKKYIYTKLLQKGFSKDTIEEALSGIEDQDQHQTIKKAALKKQRQNESIDKNKLVQYLLRQGFLYSDICVVLDELVFGEHELYNNTNNQ